MHKKITTRLANRSPTEGLSRGHEVATEAPPERHAVDTMPLHCTIQPTSPDRKRLAQPRPDIQCSSPDTSIVGVRPPPCSTAHHFQLLWPRSSRGPSLPRPHRVPARPTLVEWPCCTSSDPQFHAGCGEIDSYYAARRRRSLLSRERASCIAPAIDRLNEQRVVRPGQAAHLSRGAAPLSSAISC